MRAAGSSLDDFANKSDATAARTEASAGRLSKVFLGLGVAVAAALIGAVGAAASFETQMRNVASLGGVTDSSFKQMSASVLDLSRTLPQSANDLAKGLYDIASSGFQGAEGLEVLEASAKAASAGLATTAEAAKAVTAVLNAYGLESSEARRVSDILFQTVNLGVVSFSELTGVIGDVVGSAAAAGVSIEQVGAAIATMTLSGVSASEAGTSLNRVIQSFIKPSDEMKLALRSIGYESGVSALKQDGLRVVMDKLRIATGGNVEVTVQLFDEIRAARGALALMSDEGANYARVVDGMAQATEGAGATQRAFAEQSKALSFQLKQAKNEVMALVIEGATPLLGFLKDAIAGLRDMAQAAGPGLGAALQALRPFFAGLVAVGGDLIVILRTLWENVGPLVAALGSLAAGTVIAALNTMAGALSTITGFMAANKEVTTALGLALVGLLVAGQVADVMVALPVIFEAMSVTAAKAALAAGNLAATLSTVKGAAAALGVVTGIVALTGAVTNFTSATAAAKKSRDDLLSDVDMNSLKSISDALSEIDDKIREADAIHGGPDANIFGQIFKGALDMLPLVDTGFTKAVNRSVEFDKAWRALAARSRELALNIDEVRLATGLTTDEISALATKLGVDLSQSFSESGPARKAIIDDYRKMGAAALEVGVEVKAGSLASKESIEAFAAEIEATKKLLDGVRDSFRKDTDSIGGYSKFLAEATKGNEAFNTAQEKLIDAQANLRDLQSRQAADTKISISDQQALAKAHDKVAEAQNGVAEAAKALKGADLSSFYVENTAKAQKFADDIQELARRGLDPAVIMRLMQAGPEAAAPFIQGILTSNNANIIGIVNEGEKALATITQKVVANARLTQMAITDAFSDQKVRDLALAMEVSAASIDASGNITREAIAEKIGKPLEDVTRVVDEFHITVSKTPGALAPATASADKLSAALRNIEGTYIAEVNLNTNGAEEKIARLKSDLAQFNAELDSAYGSEDRARTRRLADAAEAELAATESGGGTPDASTGVQTEDHAIGGVLGRTIALAGGGRTKGFRTSGPTYLVGEGDPAWPEYVIASDPAYAKRNQKLWMMAGKRLGMLAAGGVVGMAEGGVIYEEDPRWDWRTMGNHTRGVYIDGQGWMLQDASGNLSPHPSYPPGTPKKDGMVREGDMWVPAGTAAYPVAQGGNQTRILSSSPSGNQTRITSSYPSHQASSFVSRPHDGGGRTDFRGMMSDLIRAVEGMGHDITIEVDGDVIARVAAKGMAKMGRR